MKVLLYSEGMNLISKSGVGKAIRHQMKALDLNQVPFSTDKDTSNYDIVHINTFGIKSYLLAKNARRKGKKVIMHAHTTEEDFRNSFILSNAISPLFKKWLVKVYRQGDRLITPTPYSKSVLEKYDLQIPIHAVSNGISLDAFQRDPQKGKNFRAYYGFDEATPIILCVGLMIHRKGILDVIEIAQQMPDCQFVWCGYTNPHLITKEIRSAIRTKPANMHFLGFVDELISAYSAADVFFMPTYEENEGIVILEALAMKTPIVVRDIPVYHDWLDHGIHCYKGKNNSDFITYIRSILTKEAPDFSEAGYDIVKNRSLQIVGNQLKQIYSLVLGGVS